MNILFKIVVVLIFLLCSKLVAQQSWTLDDCVGYALEHNLQLNDFEYTEMANGETFKQSVRSLLPRINGFSSYDIRFGRSIDPNDNSIVNTDFFSNNYSLETTVDLFQGFQKQNAIKASKLVYKAAQEETLQQKYLLAFRVMQAFYDIRFFEGIVAISIEQLSVSETNYKLIKKQIELGLKAGADLYEAESILFSDKLRVTQSENQLQTAKLKLIQEMNLEKVTDIVTQIALKDSLAWNPDDELLVEPIYSEAKTFIPIIKAQQLRVKAAQKQLAMARGGFYPSISLFGGLGTGYFETNKDSLGMTIPFRRQFRDNTYQYVGISLNVPIINGWSARSSVKQQKIERMRAENNLEVQEQLLYQAIQLLVQENTALQIEYVQSNEKLKSQHIAFTIAQKRYEQGMINAIELITAKTLLASAQNENLQVRLRSEVNKSTLAFYRGLPVFNIN